MNETNFLNFKIAHFVVKKNHSQMIGFFSADVSTNFDFHQNLITFLNNKNMISFYGKELQTIQS